MILSEMRDLYDHYGTYDSWDTVQFNFDSGFLPESFQGVIPTHCKCGSEIMIKNNFRYLTCVDPFCPIKQYKRMSEIISRSGALGIGDESCKEFYEGVLEKNKFLIEQGRDPIIKSNSIIEMIGIPFSSYPSSFASKVIGTKFYDAVQDMLSKKRTFPELVQLLAIPGLSNAAHKLFDKINSVPQWVEEVNRAGGIANFCCTRGICDSEVHFWINLYRQEIMNAWVLFGATLRRQGLTKLEVVLTGRLYVKGEYLPKATFINYCNSLAKSKDGVQLMEIKDCDARHTVPYIVYSVADSTTNQTVGRNRGSCIDFDGVDRPVLTLADDFVEIVKLRTQALEEQYDRLREERDICKETKAF